MSKLRVKRPVGAVPSSTWRNKPTILRAADAGNLAKMFDAGGLATPAQTCVGSTRWPASRFADASSAESVAPDC